MDLKFGCCARARPKMCHNKLKHNRGNNVPRYWHYQVGAPFFLTGKAKKRVLVICCDFVAGPRREVVFSGL